MSKQHGPHSAAELEALGPSIVPDGTECGPVPETRASARPPSKAVHAKIDIGGRRGEIELDARIDIARDPADPRVIVVHDRGGKGSVDGLSLRVGPRSASWYFDVDKIEKKHRTVKRIKLGEFDRGSRDENPVRATWHMSPQAARDAATLKSAAYIRREASGGKALKFAEVFKQYLAKLQTKADDNGKAARWRRNVENLGNKYLLPRWGGYTLSELSEAREQVGDWYNSISLEAPSTALHLRSIIQSVYNWRLGSGATLPAANPAMAPITKKPAYKTPQGRKALPRVRLEQFPAWLADWRKITDPMQRAYWLFLLYTGQRPGETIRTAFWGNIDREHNTITLLDSKSGADIVVPLSPAIWRVLDLAKQAAGDTVSDAIFFGPNADHWSHRSPPLGVPGQGMRRTFKTVAASLGILNEMSGRLLGHQPAGVSAGYADPLAVQRAEFLNDLQDRVSAAIIKLLGSDPTTETFAPLPPSPRDVARAAGMLRYVGECSKHGPTDYSVATGRCLACISELKKEWRKRRSHRRGNPLRAA